MDPFLDSFAHGKTGLGLWLSIPDTLAAETLGRAGYDFVILDGQHGGIGWDAVLPMVQALDLVGTATFMRVLSNDAGLIMRALDLGARGVIVPLVDTPEQAARAAQATRYPPHGGRSFGQVRRYYSAGGGEAPQPLCFVMIETTEAMRNLDAIAATPGIDGLFVGPADLALSMGMDMRTALTFPDTVMAEVDKVIAACARHAIVAGCPAFGVDNGRVLQQRGIRFLPLGADIGLLRRGAAADLEQARGWSAE
jgi:4-hydroxy-2-oxoheptanedioate aldolase